MAVPSKSPARAVSCLAIAQKLLQDVQLLPPICSEISYLSVSDPPAEIQPDPRWVEKQQFLRRRESWAAFPLLQEINKQKKDFLKVNSVFFFRLIASVLFPALHFGFIAPDTASW